MQDYLTIESNSNMGLNNYMCRDKRFFCTSKKVFLSASDVCRKQCFNKPDKYMISTSKCENLITAEEYEAIYKRQLMIENNIRSEISDFEKYVNDYGISVEQFMVILSRFNKLRGDCRNRIKRKYK